MYTFRFGTSDKVVHLTQEKLDLIPYLATLVTHKDDFSSIQNEHGEYVLNSPIHYTWFMAILNSITSQQPCTLFSELPEDENVLDTFQLFDYLGVNPVPLPLLKDEVLLRSNIISTENEQKHALYRKANLLEARNTAAEFIIALSKNAYNLDDSCVLTRIFSLITIIFSNTNVFSSRFRQHTLTVLKECCPSLYLKKQHLLPTSQQIVQNSKIDSLMYFYDDHQPLPENFENTFAWRGAYVPIDKYKTDYSVWYPRCILVIGPSKIGKSAIINSLFGITNENNLNVTSTETFSMLEMCNNKKLHRNEARSEHFNTLPKRPNIDKFTHRFGPKAQKHRFGPKAQKHR